MKFRLYYVTIYRLKEYRMRARKKKNTQPRLERCEAYLVDKIAVPDGKKAFLEIGCGKGKFITGLAELHPENFYFAMEKVPDVMVMAAEKCKAAELENVRFLLEDANALPEICPENSLDGIYLNFSDPWPKKRHTSRRLTYRSFLEKYKKLLKEDGWIKMKTDNGGLFEFSLEEFAECGFSLSEVTEDLHATDIENEVMTEYETRFSEQGMNIYHLKAEIKRG